MNQKTEKREQNKDAVVQLLSKILADEFVLYTKTRKAHWNVEGQDFYTMHLFFENQFTTLATNIDNIAERIRTLGHYPPASLKEYLELTQLSEQSRYDYDSRGFVTQLLIDHESIIILLRKNIDQFASVLKDLGTSDFITGLLLVHEKMAWMLRSHAKSE